MYCIVDIETTGNGIKGNKITEISIFKFDGDQIIDEFTSLVNPECEIPYFITGLTGIDNHLVRNAPTLEAIAPQIEAITSECIFVAHSVNFDYNVIKHEFKNIGRDFIRKKLCTVRLSRKLIPGYHSYSLGKLCSALDIPLKDRHRARGDAHATVLLFRKLIGLDGSEAVFKTFLNARSQEATLPPGLAREVYNNLPQEAGIYYFKNSKGEIIYVGKAINIKKRVLSHFYDKSTKEVRMCNETTDVDFEISGSEIVALLMESAAIKSLYPPYNRAQKRRIQQYGIFSYEDRNGILHLAFNKLKLAPQPLLILNSTTDCRLYLEQLCEEFQLCAKYCHLQENVSSCSHYRLNNCEGICRDEESPEDYNKKVRSAMEYIRTGNKDVVIKDKGRHKGEDAVILITNGQYNGFGFISKDITISSIEDISAHITPQQNTVEAQRLVFSYLLKNPHKILNTEPDKVI
ncbi:exonuclease domain-containing protein [Muriicola sp. Z0-33]|uniref:exonuclease domain-containing protein n=1 Tax=Muriicola sp. Z0-33 TaxID=2816957 RepID=UPI002238A58E|nr:exonuclease domain-containing protein [Muriicola sp. Z0-33]MCW5516858.1 GIY-YIG nuclease family protein [Muriicola sp. Z0-33]